MGVFELATAIATPLATPICPDEPIASEYAVTFSCVHGSVGATVDGVGIQSGDMVERGKTVIFTITPDEHYEYRTGSNPESVVVNSAVTRNYECSAVVYSITVTASHGIVSGAGAYPYGSTCTLEFEPEEHYHFVEWSDHNTDNPRTFTVTGGLTLSVEGVQDTQYTLSFSAVNGSVDYASFTGYPGDTKTVTVSHFAGYTFNMWNDGNMDNPRTFVVGSDDANYVATCIQETYIISVNTSHGTVTGSGSYHYGDTVVMEVTPDAGYVFDEWSDGNRDNPRTEVVYMSKSYNARCEEYQWAGLKFTSTGASTISFVQQGTWEGTWPIDTSLDGGLTWSEYTLGTSISLIEGQSVCFRGNKDSTAQTTSNYRKFVMTGSIAASGDVTSILNGTGGVMDLTSYGVRTLIRLFSGCTSLTTAPSLPATTLASYCYSYMFYGCTSLTTAPSLPATTLASYCYSNMFNGCTSLTTAPSLPATTLAGSCYNGMFRECTSLTTAPSLPATTLAGSCYGYMFYGCTSLTTTPSLPATTLAEWCYSGMFSNCTSLTTTPSLPATTLAEWCYSGMFSNCTSLTTTPSLPATTLASYCYFSMFSNCTSLTGPVNISATSPYYSGTTTACSNMFASSATSSGAGGIIYVGGNVSLWNSTNCGINSTYWTVQQISDGE